MPILFFHPCPKPTPEAVQHLRAKLSVRGAAWARDYMAKTGGADNYPPSIVRLVERHAREEAEQLQLEVAA